MLRAAVPASLVAGIALVCGLLAPPAAGAEIYKWVDEKGVVNYGEHPPRQRSATVLTPERTPLSVYPATTSGGASAAGTDPAIKARVEQLERELERQRQQREASAGLAAEREALRLERCRLERRVDCEAEILGVDYPTLVIHRSAHGFRHRPPSRPHPARPASPKERETEQRRALRMPPAPH